jgi:hypothetical protein
MAGKVKKTKKRAPGMLDVLKRKRDKAIEDLKRAKGVAALKAKKKK